MQDVRQFGGDNVSRATDENGAAQFRELQQRLGGLLDHFLRRGMHAKNIGQRVFNLRRPILRQKLGEILRQIVIGQHVVDQFVVEVGLVGGFMWGVLVVVGGLV